MPNYDVQYVPCPCEFWLQVLDHLFGGICFFMSESSNLALFTIAHYLIKSCLYLYCCHQSHQ